MIEIVDALERAAAAKSAQDKVACEFRAMVVEALSALKDRLGRFGQTTHSAICDGSIDWACERLVDAWKEPSAFNISNLSQCIDKFIALATPACEYPVKPIKTADAIAGSFCGVCGIFHIGPCQSCVKHKG